MMLRKLSVALSFGVGIALTVATQAPTWYLSSEPVVLAFELSADSAFPIEAQVECTGLDADLCFSAYLSLRTEATNTAPSSGRIALYRLQAPWDGTLPDTAEEVSDDIVRGGLVDEPAEVIVSFSVHDVLDQDVYLVLLVAEGAPHLEGQLTVTASVGLVDAPDDEAALSVQVL